MKSKYEVRLNSSFVPHHETAPADKRYLDKYYYDDPRSQWYLILGVVSTDKWPSWSVRKADLNGWPSPKAESLTMPLWASRFADRPFDVNQPLETDWAWFNRLASNLGLTYDQQELHLMFKSYIKQREITNHWEALTYIGVKNGIPTSV